MERFQDITTTPATEIDQSIYQLAEFWDVPPEQRGQVLIEAIQKTHAWHYARNPAYQRTVSARGIGPTIHHTDLPRLLRPTSQTFKSYIEILGTPFPQDLPGDFVEWLDDQLSIELPRTRFTQFRSRYSSLETLLLDVERVFSDLDLEILTSSGTSGRATIMVRDQDGITCTVESFYLAFQRYMKMQANHRMIFVMPQETRIAMARMAGFSARRIGVAPERVHFTIPFTTQPDQIRVRTGRTYRQGWRGILERRLMNPFMNWAYEQLAMPRTIRGTLKMLELAETEGDKVLLFGGWMQLHAIALHLQSEGRIFRLASGSLLGTGGGFKELYPFGPERIRQDLAQVMVDTDGEAIPLRDVYGMAEANWAAMQCQQGNYHLPPWVYTVTMDPDDRFQHAPQSTGLLAFYDPYGGGELFPAFFKSADQVHLVNGSAAYDPTLTCPCGDATAYLTQGSIQRVDLLDEAGCAAQI